MPSQIHISLWRYLCLIPVLMLLAACGAEESTGAGKVRWDREICIRCAMAVSSPNYSAQIRGGEAERKTKLYKFDDVGCAVIWLDEQPWKDDPRTEIWVNHHNTKEWIDAKTAWYIPANNTPMDYGLGAQVEPQDDALSFEQAKAHIYEVEKRFNGHSGQPLPTDTSSTQ